MVEPTTVMAAAGALKPDTLNAVGGVIEKTGNGVGSIFHSVGTIGTEHHQIAADAKTREMEIISGMSPDQMKVYLDYKRAAEGDKTRSIKHLFAYSNPFTAPFALLSDWRDRSLQAGPA